MKKLTEKQKRFIDYYIETGNASEACRLAGYKGTNVDRIGHENLRKLEVYITERLKELNNERTASIEDIQQFWTEVLKDDSQSMNNRLKASEMLYRGRGGFVDKVEVKEINCKWSKSNEWDNIRQ